MTMRSFQRVTVGLSLTAGDASLLQYAGAVARLGVTREFRFVHVAGRPDRINVELHRAEALTRLEAAVAAEFDAGGAEHVSCHVVEGSRAEGLVEFAAGHGSELMLLGHSPQRGRNSLAQRIAMIASASILVVPSRAPPQITRVLAPIDFSQHSADSLSQAAAITCLSGLEECLALHVEFCGAAIGLDLVEEYHGVRHDEFTRFLKPVNAHGVAIVPQFVPGAQVAPTILRAAQRAGADLIVVSTRGSGPGESGPLGTVAAQVLMESPIPVLAARHYRQAADFHASHTA